MKCFNNDTFHIWMAYIPITFYKSILVAQKQTMDIYQKNINFFDLVKQF
jgi:hypothetical protein